VLANLHKRPFCLGTRIVNSAVARHGSIGIICRYRYMIVGSAPPMLHLIVHFVIAFQLACVGS
jgi:hypothetical protein